jgi:hypothetical protein
MWPKTALPIVELLSGDEFHGAVAMPPVTGNDPTQILY